MALPMRTSGSGLELIKSFEGFRARAAQLPNGKWIIGFGHTDSARSGLRVTRIDAEMVLRHHDLAPIEALISERVFAPLAQNEFDALVSFIFNIGDAAFLESAVLANLNRGDRLQAAGAMTAWRKGQVDGELKVLDALVRRRAAEQAMFLEHPAGRAPVPSAMIRAELDSSASLMAPKERAVIVETRVENNRANTSTRPKNTDAVPAEAARAVAERLTRILGENASKASGQTDDASGNTQTVPGPSAEEITDAIKALADPDGPADDVNLPLDVLKHDALQLGPPDGVERRKSPRPTPPPFDPPLDLDDQILPPAENAVIDDLQPIEVDPETIERAASENGIGAIHSAPARGLLHDLGRSLPYALLTGLGLLGTVFGIQKFLATSQAETLVRESDIYIGPILALGSGFVFLISAYYLFRALNRGD